jgi:hypothetical protein
VSVGAGNVIPGRLSYCAGVNSVSESHLELQLSPTDDAPSTIKDRRLVSRRKYARARPA